MDLFPDPLLSPYTGCYSCLGDVTAGPGVLHFAANAQSGIMARVTLIGPLAAAIDAALTPNTDYTVSLDIAVHTAGSSIYIRLLGGVITEIPVSGDGVASGVVHTGAGGQHQLRDNDQAAAFNIVGIHFEPVV